MPTNLKKAFGQRLRIVRHDRSLTQEQLAAASGYSPEYIRRIERGGASPSFDTLSKLADILEVQVKDLFDFSTNASSEPSIAPKPDK